MTINGILTGAGFVLFGFAAGWIINSLLGKRGLLSAKKESERILLDAKEEAESEKKEKLIEAEEEIFQQKQDLEEQFRAKQNSFKQVETELLIKENNIDRKADLIAKKERDIYLQQREITNKENQTKLKQEKLDRLLDEENKKLEVISGLTREDARKILMDNLIESAQKEASEKVYKIVDDAKKQAQTDAKNIIICAMEQSASDHAVESTVSIVALPSDDMKGRIIGREGRNIRAFEIVTGIDVIVDDTPEAVILSGYDPYRRETARITMEKLVKDGRIHPGRIEETYEKTVQEMVEYFNELGEQALLETGVHALHPDLITTIGKLRFRTTYGQNVLQHCKEVSIIAGIMAAELGLDENLAKRAGLLHDVGLAVERHSEGNHCQAGYDYAKKYNEHPIVLNAIAAHKGDIEAISPIAIIVQIANNISRTRPGARRDVIDKFIGRMLSFEEIACSFEGVKQAYSIQAGKEVRVIIDFEKISDSESYQLAKNIAQKIQEEIEYPGQIKVTAIREFRSIELA